MTAQKLGPTNPGGNLFLRRVSWNEINYERFTKIEQAVMRNRDCANIFL